MMAITKVPITGSKGNIITFKPLINHRNKITCLVLLSVTTCSYLRCRYIARYRSTLIAVIVKRVTTVKNRIIKLLKLVIVHEGRSIEVVKSIWTSNPTLIGPNANPTHRSDKARPNNKVFEGECKFGLLHIVTRTKRFSSVAVTEIKMLIIISMIRILGS